MFFQPALLTLSFYPAWIVWNLIWDLSVLWISSLVGHRPDKPLISGTGAQRHDCVALEMRSLTRLGRPRCTWSKGTLYGHPCPRGCGRWTERGTGLRSRDVSPPREEQGLPLLSSSCGLASNRPDSGGIVRKGPYVGGGCQWKGL